MMVDKESTESTEVTAVVGLHEKGSCFGSSIDRINLHDGGVSQLSGGTSAVELAHTCGEHLR